MRRRAYTLIELLMVIAIIGILIGIASFTWNAASMSSRDSTRKTDLERIKTVLEQYSTQYHSYPTFDAGYGGRFYSADWQLDSAGVATTCPHDTAINARLTPGYLTDVPHDPKYPFTGDCGANQNQKGNYLYLSSPTPADGTAPDVATAARGYALLATMERAQDQTLTSATSPITTKLPNLTYYYDTALTGSPYNIDANYMIVGGATR